MHSAGTSRTDVVAPRPLLEERHAFDIDLAALVPRTVDPAMVEAADLAVGLTRQHVRETVVGGPILVPEDVHPARDRPS